MLEFRFLTSTSIAEVTFSFNQAFADYFFPIVFTEQQFETKFATEGGRPDLSVGVFDGDRLVAFILHFVQVRNGVRYLYNGGTGVIPSHRGQGLTSRMFAFMHPRVKEAKVDRMILEALTQNAPAIHVYQSVGYEIKRELWCFSGSLKERKLKIPLNGVSIAPLETIDWEQLQSFWDYPPTWQNSNATMQNLLKENLYIGIQLKDALVGYAIFNPAHRRVHQFAVAKTHRRVGIGSHLLNHLAALANGKVSMINLDTRISGMKQILEAHGLDNFGNQYEMEASLS